MSKFTQTAVVLTVAASLLVLSTGGSLAQDGTNPGPGAPAAIYNEELARSLGADDYGMKSYVLVILKTGPTRVPEGPERDEMFRAHLANIHRLAAEGKLAHAGPLDGVDGWRGLFLFAVSDIEEATKLVATDPVVIKGEMVAEYHKHYGSAALMLVGATHETIVKKSF